MKQDYLNKVLEKSKVRTSGHAWITNESLNRGTGSVFAPKRRNIKVSCSNNILLEVKQAARIALFFQISFAEFLETKQQKRVIDKQIWLIYNLL